MYRASFIVLY